MENDTPGDPTKDKGSAAEQTFHKNTSCFSSVHTPVLDMNKVNTRFGGVMNSRSKRKGSTRAPH